MAPSSQDVSFWQALTFWFKLGWISFGGPAGQISIMHQELVEQRRWISENHFLHALNFTMVLPGPEAQQLATYLGWLMHGTWGGILAGLLFVLPSLLILIGLSWIYLVYGNVEFVAGILYGIKPAITAVVVFAAYNIGQKFLKNNLLISLACLAFVALFVFNLPFPLIIITAGLIGMILGRYYPQYFSTAEKDSHSPKSLPHLETPKRKWTKTLLPLWIGVGIWLSALLSLIFWLGGQNPLIEMGVFFTKMALVTFGGAYAVLPYVYQGGVESYGWLTATQMMDGLALGETTPGPLIMVVAFVGFVGGWTQSVLGADNLFLSGAFAASVVTFFTFLPSFIFILVGAPLVEASRNNLKLSAPLMAISAAVVGVILNLALFFAFHVFWPQGFSDEFEWFSGILCGLAILALFRFKLGIVTVIAVSALLGMLYQLI